jgi:hypothetical protein
MNKKDILFILLPCVLFISLAIFELHLSGIFSFDAQLIQSSQGKFEQFVGGVSSGEVDKATIVRVLRNSRETQSNLDVLASRWFRCLGWLVLIYVALQVSIVFMLWRKTQPNNSLQTTAAAPASCD